MGLIPTLNHPVAGDPRVPTPFYENDVAIRTVVNGNIDATNITAASVTDACLASPVNATYKTLVRAGGQLGGLTTGTAQFFTVGGTVVATGAGSAALPPLGYRYLSGDFGASSLTTRFRVTMDVLVGSTSPSTTVITAGLYPVTISGGNFTLGTVVSGSTVASSGLATNTISPFATSDFAASALTTNTFYTLGVIVSTLAVPAGIDAVLTLSTRAT